MAEGRFFYRIGDRMEYLGQKVTIMEVEGIFGYGGLTFKYILDNHVVHQPNFTSSVPFAAGQKIMGYKCKLQLAPGWQTGNVHTHIWNADKNKYEAVFELACLLTSLIQRLEEYNFLW
ncbi:hypothetical protein ADH76_33035 [Enterocloster clostridioformis]|uniref:hypothetical protein n=2 Tax=Enterocloster clostridioformis TaxID=1531 RepID=UPI00080CB09A|nr:hypothetical protein [Enterocloster clostridioformis]ANU49099.1 hypothetical protein A4V08_28035 [Lachnoclostridium sp. YL32]NDO26841.1 hypothetical protein [Enterocloster clostridioformis]OXE61942.1 hypothetical protein ADH76_33035 [Enterocloster clostridioformis]QQR01976.1 hypothetical protein I5Q83_06630 [Enterocloster clostridioformis]